MWQQAAQGLRCCLVHGEWQGRFQCSSQVEVSGSGSRLLMSWKLACQLLTLEQEPWAGDCSETLLSFLLLLCSLISFFHYSKVPTFVRMLAPEGALNIHEKAWNAYPYCRTVITNEYMKEDFLIKIETWHKPDLGTQENVHKLEPEAWKHVEAIYIDIADRSQVLSKDYKAEEDPAKFKSIKTGRGPLGPNWKQELVNQKDCPYMCAYKLVTVKFKWWGLQNKVENFIHKQEKRLFTNFHRQLFCWLDKWVDLTMDDIRRMEEETKRQLDEMRQKDPVKGMTADD